MKHWGEQDKAAHLTISFRGPATGVLSSLPPEEHHSYLFQQLKEANLKLNTKKCDLFQREVKYLGHMVSAQGVSPDPEKVEAIQMWPRPMSITDAKSFLGLPYYYRHFIAGFANIAAPLHEYIKKTTTFVWSTEAQASFTKLKTVLCTCAGIP